MIDKLIQQFPRATFIMLLVFVVLIFIRLLSGDVIDFNEGLAWQFKKDFHSFGRRSRSTQ
jgi:Na+/H+ antiporter NhaC